MRSGTSFFDLAIYRKTVNRFWPLWAVNLVFWLFILPFSGLVTLSETLAEDEGNMAIWRFARNVGDYATELGVVVSLIAGLVVAMAVCSHLYNNRSANFMGSLPARREGQFISTYLGGLTILIGPNLLVFLLTLLVEVAGGAVIWGSLLFWLGAMCAMEFFFYSFAVCLGQFAGHILALPAFYGIFNALVIAVYYLLDWVMGAYYFGFRSFDWGENLVMWCTPVMALFQMDINVFLNTTERVMDAPLEVLGYTVEMEGLWIAGVYAIVGLVLAACALLLYRHRHLETAGDIVAVKAMRPVFKYGVAICSGLFLGFLTAQMFGFGELGLTIVIILWGIIGCFVAQMLLDKSIRVFKKWKGAAAVTAVFLVLFAVVGFDLTGYETRVPDANQVEEVYVTGLQGYPYDSGSHLNIALTEPEVIGDVVALHEAVVELREYGDRSASGSGAWNSFDVTYRLKSGETIRRGYDVYMGDTMLPLAQQLIDRDEVRYKAYGLDVLEEFVAQGGQLERTYIHRDGYDDVELWGTTGQELWDAVMTDFANGNIGVHVVDNSEKAYDDWMNEYQFIEVGGRLYTDCSVEFVWVRKIPQSEVEYPDAGGTQYRHLQINVMESSVETLRVLDELLHEDNRYQDDPNDNPLWRSE